MNVRELIEILEQIENKDINVFVYNPETTDLFDCSIDIDTTERVDINIGKLQ